MHSAPLITKALPIAGLPYGAHGNVIHRIGLAPAMNFTSVPCSRVLCFSRDRVLGETRRTVLQRRYDTVFVGSLEELASLASGSPFDVIVLCHTLSVQDRAACLEFAKDVWPSARIVSVSSSKEDKRPEFDAVVFGLEGPGALLNAVQQVLEPTRPGIGPS